MHNFAIFRVLASGIRTFFLIALMGLFPLIIKLEVSTISGL